MNIYLLLIEWQYYLESKSCRTTSEKKIKFKNLAFIGISNNDTRVVIPSYDKGDNLVSKTGFTD